MDLTRRRVLRCAAYPQKTTVDLEAIKTLVRRIIDAIKEDMGRIERPDLPGDPELPGDLCQVACILERAEAQFQEFAGDPAAAASTAQRSHFAIGKLGEYLTEEVDVWEYVSDLIERCPSPLNTGCNKARSAAALRFMLAYTTYAGLIHPLTEENFVMRLRQQAFSNQECGLGANIGEEDEYDEAIKTYAAGLLAIALTSHQHCEEAVRMAFVSPVVTYLHSCIAALNSNVELRSPSARQQTLVRALQIQPHPVTRPLQGVDELPLRELGVNEQSTSPANEDVQMSESVSPAPEAILQDSAEGQDLGNLVPSSPHRNSLAPTHRAVEKEDGQCQVWVALPTVNAAPSQEAEAIQAEADVPTPVEQLAVDPIIQEGPATDHLEKADTSSTDKLSTVEKQQQKVEGAARHIEEEEIQPLPRHELRSRRLLYMVQCATSLGEYLEFLPPLMSSGGIKLVLRLLDAWKADHFRLNCALKMLVALLAHRKLADALIDEGGVDLLLTLPRVRHTQTSLALVKVGLVLIPTAFQKLVALPSPTPQRFLEASLEHIVCPIDSARKSAAVFLCSALFQPVILDAFDRLSGPKRILAAIMGSLFVLRSGIGQEWRHEKQICYHLCQALSLYFRCHFVQRLRLLNQQPSTDQIPVDQESLDAAFAILGSSKEAALAFALRPWAPAVSFSEGGGHSLMLDIIEVPPGERYFTEMAIAALEVLSITTLVPSCREALLACTTSRTTGDQQNPVAILLSTAGGLQATVFEAQEARQAALRAIVNCVMAPVSLCRQLSDAESRPLQLASKQDAQGAGSAFEQALELGYASARSAIRHGNGLRTMLSLLQPNSSSSASCAEALLKIRTLASQALLGLARDPDICHTLTKLHVGKRLAELVHETAGVTNSSRSASHSLEFGSSVAWREAFTATAMELISKITPGMGEAGSLAAVDAAAPTLHKMERAAIAASSHITYEPAELLRLIVDHLAAAGLSDSAATLTREAALQSTTHYPQPPTHRPPSGIIAAKKRITFAPSVQKPAVKAVQADALTPPLPPKVTPKCTAETANHRLGGPRQEISNLAAPCGTAADVSGQLVFETPRLDARREDARQTARKRTASFSLASNHHPQSRLSGSWNLCEEKWDDRGPQGTPGWHRNVAARVAEADADPAPDNQRSVGPSGIALRTPPHTDASYICSGLQNLPAGRGRRPPLEATEAVCNTPQLARSVAKQVLASPPDRTPFPGASTSQDKASSSRLSNIVLQYLRQQHKSACLSARQPVTTLPPLSLIHANTLPQAKHPLAAPKQVTKRVLESQISRFGGVGGKREHRHFIYNRFRHQRSIRVTEDVGAVLKCCSFMTNGEKLLVGTFSGEIRLYHDFTSDAVEEFEAHTTATQKLQVYEGGGQSLVLSSSRQEVKLWDAGRLDREPLHTFHSNRSGVFSADASKIAVCTSRSAAANVFDTTTGCLLLTINECAGMMKATRDICFNKTNELLLWGPALWDPRAPRMVHCFDVFGENCGSSIFHPAGLEAILNTEVWDLRTLRLLRSASCLDGASLSFNSNGDVAYATLRRTSEDLQSKRSHPLCTAFRTVDITDFSEIATIDVDGRVVLDLASDPLDSSLAVITMEPEGLSSSTRIYDIGRKRLQGDEVDDEVVEGSDADDSDGTDDEDDAEAEEAGMLQMSDAEEAGETGDQEGEGGDDADDEEDSEIDSTYSDGAASSSATDNSISSANQAEGESSVSVVPDSSTEGDSSSSMGDASAPTSSQEAAADDSEDPEFQMSDAD